MPHTSRFGDVILGCLHQQLMTERDVVVALCNMRHLLRINCAQSLTNIF